MIPPYMIPPYIFDSPLQVYDSSLYLPPFLRGELKDNGNPPKLGGHSHLAAPVDDDAARQVVAHGLGPRNRRHACTSYIVLHFISLRCIGSYRLYDNNIVFSTWSRPHVMSSHHHHIMSHVTSRIFQHKVSARAVDGSRHIGRNNLSATGLGRELKPIISTIVDVSCHDVFMGQELRRRTTS
jgi:hypothetical protein